MVPIRAESALRIGPPAVPARNGVEALGGEKPGQHGEDTDHVRDGKLYVTVGEAVQSANQRFEWSWCSCHCGLKPLSVVKRWRCVLAHVHVVDSEVFVTNRLRLSGALNYHSFKTLKY